MCVICGYDPCDFRCPEKKYKISGICSFCYDEIYDNELLNFEDMQIHRRCMHHYIKQVKKDEYFENYINKNQFDFYYSFWFDFLNKKEKIEIIKNAFLLLKEEEKSKLILDFCFQDFKNFKKFMFKGIKENNENY